MKRLFTLFLALVMMLSCLPAMAEYDKHITFTTSLIETGSPASYTDDAVYHAVMDQFNMDFEVCPSPGTTGLRRIAYGSTAVPCPIY